MRPVDLAIVGGGPAGLSTALHLVQRNPAWSSRLIVLEKARHPRHKLCGGGVTPFGLRQLKSLGLELKVPSVAIERADFVYRGRHIQYRRSPAFRVVRRDEFDAWLAAEAKRRGIEILERTPVKALQRERDGIRIETRSLGVLAKTMVGTDGARGVVRPWLGARERPPQVARLLEIVTADRRGQVEVNRSVATFDFDWLRDRLRGYGWNFPCLVDGQPALNIGVYDSPVNRASKRAALRQLLEHGLERFAGERATGRIEGHPIRLFSPRNKIADDRVILAGDAAGVEPLFGEGIGIALGYGEVAAAAVERAFERGDFSFRGYRRRLLLSPVGGYMLLRWAVAQLLYHTAPHKRAMQLLWQLFELVNEALEGLKRQPARG